MALPWHYAPGPGSLAPVTLGYSDLTEIRQIGMTSCMGWYEPERSYAIAIPVALLLTAWALIAILRWTSREYRRSSL